MIRLVSVCLLLNAAAQICRSELIFDWAHVGNAGNAADPETGFGSVSYRYAIAKTEVTNAQYVEFLNAVDPTGKNDLSLYNPFTMGNWGGIELKADNVVGSKFVVRAGRERSAVTYVSFPDAMRFTNWLHNGKGAADTETGAYTLANGSKTVRTANAKYWVPSENEWYKAAYHDANAGTLGVYFDYAIRSDVEPRSDRPGDDPAAANFRKDDGIANGFNDGYAVPGTKGIHYTTNPLADAGAYTEAKSPYGTFDQNGGVSELTETFAAGWRVKRGGSFDLDSRFLRASYRAGHPSLFESWNTGFRVATVPEPSTIVLLILCASGLLRTQSRRSGCA